MSVDFNRSKNKTKIIKEQVREKIKKKKNNIKKKSSVKFKVQSLNIANNNI